MESTEIIGSDLDLGETTMLYNGDPWLGSEIDEEIEKLVEELRNDPDLRTIMDMVEQQL